MRRVAQSRGEACGSEEREACVGGKVCNGEGAAYRAAAGDTVSNVLTSPATSTIVRRFAVCRPADTEGMSDADIRAAFGVELGICVSAEHLICQERAIGLESNSAADRSGALGIESVTLLRMAGINYVAWGSSR